MSSERSWNSDVWVYTPSSQRTLLIVQSFFMLLLMVGLFAVSIGICFLKESRKDALKPMPIKTTLAALVCMAISQANSFAYNTVSFRAHYAKQTYNVADLLSELFSFTSYCFLFHAFYAIVHVFADRVTKPNYRTVSVLKYVHWGVVAFFVLLCIVDWGYYVAVVDSKAKASSSYAHRYDVWVKIDSARWVVNWVSAWEIAGWAIFLGLMTSRDSVYIKYKMSAFLFVAASGCFLGLNFLYFVWDILGLLQSAKPTFDGDVTGPGETARQIVVFIFIQGLSLGMLLCYWRFPAQESQIVEDSEFEQSRIDRTALVLSEVQMSNRSKGSRFIERLSMKSPVEADSTPCARRQNTQVSYSELMAEPDRNTDGKQGHLKGSTRGL